MWLDALFDTQHKMHELSSRNFLVTITVTTQLHHTVRKVVGRRDEVRSHSDTHKSHWYSKFPELYHGTAEEEEKKIRGKLVTD